MIWAQRRFQHRDYGAHMDALIRLQMDNPTLAEQFVMVSRKSEGPGWNMFYVGVPDESFLVWFDGFGRVAENALPKKINTVHIAYGDTVSKWFEIDRM